MAHDNQRYNRKRAHANHHHSDYPREDFRRGRGGARRGVRGRGYSHYTNNNGYHHGDDRSQNNSNSSTNNNYNHGYQDRSGRGRGRDPRIPTPTGRRRDDDPPLSAAAAAEAATTTTLFGAPYYRDRTGSSNNNNNSNNIPNNNYNHDSRRNHDSHERGNQAQADDKTLAGNNNGSAANNSYTREVKMEDVDTASSSALFGKHSSSGTGNKSGNNHHNESASASTNDKDAMMAAQVHALSSGLQKMKLMAPPKTNEERVQALVAAIGGEKDQWNRIQFFDLSQPAWNEAEAHERATLAAKSWMEQEIAKIIEIPAAAAPSAANNNNHQLRRGRNDSDDDDDDDDSESEKVDMRPQMYRRTPQQELDIAKEPYLPLLDALPTFEPLWATFYTLPMGKGDLDWCFCPLGRKASTWRQNKGVDVAVLCCEKGEKFNPNAMMEHLKQMAATERQGNPERRSHGQRPIFFHAMVEQYMLALLKDFSGPGISHKACYKPLSSGFKDAEGCENKVLMRYYEQLKDYEKMNKVKDAEKARAIEQMAKVNEEKAKKEQEMLEAQTILRTHLALGKNDEEVRIGRSDLQKHQFRRERFFRFVRSHFGVMETNGESSKRLVIETPQKVKLVKILKAHFYDDLNEESAWKLLVPWEVKYSAHDVIDREKAPKEMKVKDEGGPSRALLSIAWKQLEDIKIFRKIKGGAERKSALLWDRQENGDLFPQKDEKILSDLGFPSDWRDHEEYQREFEGIKLKIRRKARAVGRLIFFCMANRLPKDERDQNSLQQNFHVEDRVLPDAYIQYCLRGIKPTSSEYPIGDLVDFLLKNQCFQKMKDSSHIKDMDTETLKGTMEWFQSYVNFYADEEAELNEGTSPMSGVVEELTGNEDTPTGATEKKKTGEDEIPLEQLRSKLRKAAEVDLIQDRKLVLDAFCEGLSLDSGLEQLDVQDLWAGIPTQAIKQMLFCKTATDVNDVIACLVPKYYCDEEEEDPNQLINIQKEVLRMEEGKALGHLPDILRDLSKDNSDFAPTFLDFVAGTRCAPYNDPDFKVTVDFLDSDQSFDSIPKSSTCTKEFIVPATCYADFEQGSAVFNGESRRKWEKKILQSLSYTCGFDCDDV